MKYPVTMQSTRDNLVVCFSSETIGHVVIGNSVDKVGDYSDGWFKATDTTHWQPYIEPEQQQVEVFEWLLTWDDDSHTISGTLRTEDGMKSMVQTLHNKPVAFKKTERSFMVDVDD